MSAGTRPAGRKPSARRSPSVTRQRLEAAYASYDSSAIGQALLAVQAATGDWVAQQRLAGAQ